LDESSNNENQHEVAMDMESNAIPPMNRVEHDLENHINEDTASSTQQPISANLTINASSNQNEDANMEMTTPDKNPAVMADTPDHSFSMSVSKISSDNTHSTSVLNQEKSKNSVKFSQDITASTCPSQESSDPLNPSQFKSDGLVSTHPRTGPRIIHLPLLHDITREWLKSLHCLDFPSGYSLFSFKPRHSKTDSIIHSNSFFSSSSSSDANANISNSVIVYLYGHPSGKPYQDWKEFQPHLIALSSECIDQCKCILCSTVHGTEIILSSRRSSPRILTGRRSGYSSPIKHFVDSNQEEFMVSNDLLMKDLSALESHERNTLPFDANILIGRSPVKMLDAEDLSMSVVEDFKDLQKERLSSHNNKSQQNPCPLWFQGFRSGDLVWCLFPLSLGKLNDGGGGGIPRNPLAWPCQILKEDSNNIYQIQKPPFKNTALKPLDIYSVPFQDLIPFTLIEPDGPGIRVWNRIVLETISYSRTWSISAKFLIKSEPQVSSSSSQEENQDENKVPKLLKSEYSSIRIGPEWISLQDIVYMSAELTASLSSSSSSSSSTTTSILPSSSTSIRQDSVSSGVGRVPRFGSLSNTDSSIRPSLQNLFRIKSIYTLSQHRLPFVTGHSIQLDAIDTNDEPWKIIEQESEITLSISDIGGRVYADWISIAAPNRAIQLKGPENINSMDDDDDDNYGDYDHDSYHNKDTIECTQLVEYKRDDASGEWEQYPIAAETA